jgi:ABC-2 type transport system permease protein
MALVLTLVSALMTAISLSREKERGTLEILLVSPLRPWQIVVGKVVPYLALGMVISVTVLLSARLVFHVPLRGSVTLLLAECLLFTLTSLALGVLIAARTGSQRAAMLGALLGTLLPTALLSGMIFPIASMPTALQWVTHVVPARWFLVVVRGIMAQGVGCTTCGARRWCCRNDVAPPRRRGAQLPRAARHDAPRGETMRRLAYLLRKEFCSSSAIASSCSSCCWCPSSS